MRNTINDADAQDHVYRLANDIMTVLAGNDPAEAHTAQTLAMVATMCVLAPNDATTRLQAAEGFGRQVRELVGREDIVEWITASIIHASQAGRG